MSAMPVMSPTMMSIMTAAMMVAMMLPSFAPTVWRYHRLCSIRTRSAHTRTTLFATGYLSVWIVVSLALYAMTVAVSPMGMPSMGPSFSPSVIGAIVLVAGAVQCSRWKARRLRHCRECPERWSRTDRATAAFADGFRFGIDCVLSCAAPMAVLLVVGLMDMRMMLIVTAVITAERVAPRGDRIARLVGVVALIVGAFILHLHMSTIYLL